MFNNILRKFRIFTTILTSSILTSCSPTIIQKQEKVNQKIVDFQLDNGKEDEELELDESENRLQSKTKKNIISDSLSSNSVWFDTKNIWTRIKNWWNSWGEPLFIGLFWLSGVAGIGIASYNIHLNNKRNFKLQEGEKLKITLELQPESSITGGYWYGRFYNKGTSLEACCLCQKRFKTENCDKQSTTPGNNSVSISYYLVSGPTNPGVLLYNLDNADNKGNKENYATHIIYFKDYYPGISTLSINGYKDGDPKKSAKLGKLTVIRELIKKEDVANNSNTYECILDCKNQDTAQSPTLTSVCKCENMCSEKCEYKNKESSSNKAKCCCILEEKKEKTTSENTNQTSNQVTKCCCVLQEKKESSSTSSTSQQMSQTVKCCCCILEEEAKIQIKSSENKKDSIAILWCYYIWRAREESNP